MQVVYNGLDVAVSSTNAKPAVAIRNCVAADVVWIRPDAVIVFRIHTRKRSVGVVLGGRHRASATSGDHVSDDVTALVEQPQSGDVTLPVAGVVAGLVTRRYHYAEVASESMDESDHPSLNATAVQGDVRGVRSKHRRRLPSLRVELRVPAHHQNLRGVVPEK